MGFGVLDRLQAGNMNLCAILNKQHEMVVLHNVLTHRRERAMEEAMELEF